MKLAGFTLVESLLVLLIVTIFFGLPTIAISGWQKTMAEQQFLELFQKQTIMTQQLSITQDINGNIQKQPDQVVFKVAETRLPALKIPATVTWRGATRLVFKAGTGNINFNGAKFVFDCQHQQKRVTYTFMIGSGRFSETVEEL